MLIPRIAVVTCLLLAASTFVTPVVTAAEMPAAKPTIAEVKKETQDFLRVLKGYTAAQRDEALARSKAILADLDTHIEALESEIAANWERMSASARADAQASLRALHRQRNAAAVEYGRLQESSGAAWEEMKRGFSKAYEELHQSWEKAEQEFKAKK
jgi:hypothetical protein